MTSSIHTSTRPTGTTAQSGLALIAAIVSSYRAFHSDQPTVITVALIAALLALIAGAITWQSRRQAVAPLAVALLLELTFLWRAAPPRLINAIPLLFALALALGRNQLTFSAQESSTGQPLSGTAHPPNARSRQIAAVVSLLALAPVGVAVRGWSG